MLVAFGPFDDQPLLARGAAVAIDGVGGAHAEHRETRDELLLVAGTERQCLKLLLAQRGGEI